MAGTKSPPPLAGGGFVERKEFAGNSESLTTAPGNCPYENTLLHRAGARELFLGAGGVDKIHRRTPFSLICHLGQPQPRRSFPLQFLLVRRHVLHSIGPAEGLPRSACSSGASASESVLTDDARP